MLNEQIKAAARAIKAGGLVAYPTESVIGLGCDPFNNQAVENLLALKKRPVDKGVILVAANWEQLEPLLQPVNPQQLEQMLASWPGATTWVVPCKPEVSPLIRGRFSSLAVRIPGHEGARALCAELGHPIVSTSANFAGEPPAKTSEELSQTLIDSLEYILHGETKNAAKPSQIIDLLSGDVLR